MIDQCVICKRYKVFENWTSKEDLNGDIIEIIDIAENNKDISHGLCPEHALTELQRIEKEMDELITRFDKWEKGICVK